MTRSSCEPELRLIGGVDEVGRGAWFGPVVAAVALTTESQQSILQELGVKDSKKLSALKRAKLAGEISRTVQEWRIGWASAKTIDQINILQASLLAMTRAVNQLHVLPAELLIDGRQTLKQLAIPQTALIKGDDRSPAIAAASILAKVWRDELIQRLDRRYPHYDLAKNKGYGTRAHREGLAHFGPTRHHRFSFRPCQEARIQPS